MRRAEITQTTGEDWSNVALNVSTVRTARGGNAPELNSLIVQYPQLLGGAGARRVRPSTVRCGDTRRSAAPKSLEHGAGSRPTNSRPWPKSAASR